MSERAWIESDACDCLRLAALTACLARAAALATAQSNPVTGTQTAPKYASAGVVAAVSNASPAGLAEVTGTSMACLPASAHLCVSPSQISFIVPYQVTTAAANVWVSPQGVQGRWCSLRSCRAFRVERKSCDCAHASDSPAQLNEIIVLYAAEPGRTSADLIARRSGAA